MSDILEIFSGSLWRWFCSMYLELVSVKPFYILNGSGVINKCPVSQLLSLQMYSADTAY